MKEFIGSKDRIKVFNGNSECMERYKQQSMIMLVLIIVVGLQLSLYSYVAEASSTQTYVFSPKEKIHASISSKHKNIINFEGSPITNVIGEEEKYQIIPDALNSTMFINPHVSSGEKIDLSFTNSAGEVINMVLHASDIEGQMIFIKNNAQANLQKKQEEKEIADLLRAMIRDKNNRGKYFVSKKIRKVAAALNSLLPSKNEVAGANNKTDASKHKNYQVVQDRTYSYKDFLGARLLVINKDKKLPLDLTNDDFNTLFERTLSVTIDHNIVAPKNQIYVYVIAKKE